MDIYDADRFTIRSDAIFVFDFDGVIIDPTEDDIYRLPDELIEPEVLEAARTKFGISCHGMKTAYQRHLLFQAALAKTATVSLEGPAFVGFRETCRQARSFVLTARSGWHATERARTFLSDNECRPVEIFQVGRVPKYLQIEQILKEFPQAAVFYVEDNPKHIEDVGHYFRMEDRDGRRLFPLFVERTSPRAFDEELKAIFLEALERANVRW